MRKAVMEKWVRALRSGEYKQTTGKLRDEFGFCCLGVLCDLHATHGRTGSWDQECYHSSTKGASECHYDLPTKAVVRWAGLKSREPQAPLLEDSLAQLNDDHNWSFQELADLIEENWEEL